MRNPDPLRDFDAFDPALLDPMRRARKLDGRRQLTPAQRVIVLGGGLSFKQQVLATSPALFVDASLSPLWQNSTRTTPAAAADDLVRVIDDLSGNANHITTPSDDARFTLKLGIQGGRQVLLADGTDDTGESASAVSISGNAAFTIIWVIRPTGDGSERVPGGIGDAGVALASCFLDFDARGAGIPSVEYAGNKPAIFVSYTADAFKVFSIVKTAGAIDTTTSFYINGVSQAVQAGSTTDTPNITDRVFTLGSIPNAASGYFKDYIATMILYRSALADGVRKVIENAAIKHWGIT